MNDKELSPEEREFIQAYRETDDNGRELAWIAIRAANEVKQRHKGYSVEHDGNVIRVDRQQWTNS